MQTAAKSIDEFAAGINQTSSITLIGIDGNPIRVSRSPFGGQDSHQEVVPDG
jgi:hypothetical protein